MLFRIKHSQHDLKLDRHWPRYNYFYQIISFKNFISTNLFIHVGIGIVRSRRLWRPGRRSHFLNPSKQIYLKAKLLSTPNHGYVFSFLQVSHIGGCLFYISFTWYEFLFILLVKIYVLALFTSYISLDLFQFCN